MNASVRALAIATALLALGLGGCGSSSGEPPVDPGSPPGGGETPPPDAAAGAALYADAGCGNCHGADAAGAFGPALTCFPADGLDAYVRQATSPHTGGTHGEWTDDDLAALAAWLAGDGCARHVPASHDQSQSGVMHRPGLDDPQANCTACHGENLQGFGTIPACATCHGGGGQLTCTGCHSVAQDNGDGVPVGGRRAMASELTLASHHLTGERTDADCQVCHDMSAHMQGSVRLLDVDDPSQVVVLTGDPRSSAAEAVKLEPFCLACHDEDGADGAAPFSNGVEPAPIDATAWAASSHALAQRTCLGDGETFGCHDSGHGSTKRALLGPSAGSASGVTGDTTREQEGFCYTCHTANGEASTDIQAEFARTTHHVISSAEQGSTTQLECTSCHDPHLATSAVRLKDPDAGGAWTGTFQAFCLTCHDGSPPTGVAFPSTSTGTGWDKSAFSGTTHATQLGSDSCLDCHLPHGSAYRALLQAQYVVADSNSYASGDYQMCWECHSSSSLFTSGQNAFGSYHDKHVRDKNYACAECHDVHAPYDSGERGLISFAYAIAKGWSLSLPSGTTLSSAFSYNTTLARGSCSLTCHGEGHNPNTYNTPSGN